MPNLNEVKESAKRVLTLCHITSNLSLEDKQAILNLVSFVNSVLEAKEPKEKLITENGVSEEGAIFYNQALHECRLFRAKQLLGLEETIINCNVPTACKDSGQPEWTVGEAKKLATAIRQMLGVEE